jgi:hypothetical protein
MSYRPLVPDIANKQNIVPEKTISGSRSPFTAEDNNKGRLDKLELCPSCPILFVILAISWCPGSWNLFMNLDGTFVHLPYTVKTKSNQGPGGGGGLL